MRIDDWQPAYQTILDDFGFGEYADRLARDWLAPRVFSFDLDRLGLAGDTVAIAGGAPCLEAEIGLARAADSVIAASDAGTRLDGLGLEPDLVVTDLDGNPDGTVALARRGVPVAVHAHGDNLPALRNHLRRFPQATVLGTTQTTPTEPLYNFGGFTDGDRAAFLADECGATQLVFPGWNFDDPDVGALKRRKLSWAKQLLSWLEQRRGEQFRVLDGHRARIDHRRLGLDS